MLFYDMLTGWSSCSKKIQGGRGGHRRAKESDENAGYQICGDEKGCRSQGKFISPVVDHAKRA